MTDLHYRLRRQIPRCGSAADRASEGVAQRITGARPFEQDQTEIASAQRELIVAGCA